MREVNVPVLTEREDLPSVSSILHERLNVAPRHVAFGRTIDGEIVDVTTAEFYREVRSIALGLLAAGVKQSDRVVIMSPTRYEWSVASFAIWEAGAVVVPVYDTASVSQTKTILDECGVRFAFAGGPEESRVISKASPDCRVWRFDSGLPDNLSDLVSMGKVAPTNEAELDRRTGRVTADDLASIVFTSGTTGRSKGARITHGNFVRLVLQVAGAYGEVVNDSASTIVLLPLAHVLAQGLQLVSVYAGMKVIHESRPQEAVALMEKVQPTFMVVVPRILEKIRAAARATAHSKKLGGAFSLAETTAIAWGEYLEKSQKDPSLKPSWPLAIRHATCDRLFYCRIRTLMGGKIDYLLSGASPLDPKLGNFFRGAGIPVLEGYGLTETTAPIAGNRPGQMRAGSVGTPIPGSTIRISEQGEVFVKGVGVTPGYLSPSDDKDAFEDGFYRTGDVGRMDEDGFLYIQGRLKNILVTANGKNIAPEPWEQTVMTDPIIEHSLMIGEGKPYAAALIILDTDEAISWAKAKGLTHLVREMIDTAEAGKSEVVRITNKEILAHVQRTVDGANRAVSRAEQVRRYAVVVADLSEENGTLAPTQKLRRTEFLDKAQSHVANIYEEEARS